MSRLKWYNQVEMGYIIKNYIGNRRYTKCWSMLLAVICGAISLKVEILARKNGYDIHPKS